MIHVPMRTQHTHRHAHTHTHRTHTHRTHAHLSLTLFSALFFVVFRSCREGRLEVYPVAYGTPSAAAAAANVKGMMQVPDRIP